MISRRLKSFASFFDVPWFLEEHEGNLDIITWSTMDTTDLCSQDFGITRLS